MQLEVSDDVVRAGNKLKHVEFMFFKRVATAHSIDRTVSVQLRDLLLLLSSPILMLILRLLWPFELSSLSAPLFEANSL